MAAMSAMPGAMPGATGQPGQQPDFAKMFLAEKENLLITPHKWDLEDVEVRLLQKYGKKTADASANKSTSTKKGPQTIRDKIKANQQQQQSKAGASNKRH